MFLTVDNDGDRAEVVTLMLQIDYPNERGFIYLSGPIFFL